MQFVEHVVRTAKRNVYSRLKRPLTSILRSTPNHVVTEDTTAPEKEYTILFTPRSGSSHLTDLLTSSGVGDPREWLNPVFLKDQAEAFGSVNFDEYFTRMRSRFSPNGVFAHEMTVEFYDAFSQEVNLDLYFNFRAPAVFLFRENIIEQAISLWFALERNVFHNTEQRPPGELPEIEYSPTQIRRWAESLAQEERRLAAVVRKKGIPARYLSYETLISTPPDVIVNAVAGLTGCKPNLQAIRSGHSKLGNASNKRYADRFRSEHEADSAALRQRRQWLFNRLKNYPLVQPTAESWPALK